MRGNLKTAAVCMAMTLAAGCGRGEEPAAVIEREQALRTRPAAVAGAFYPGDASQLEAEVRTMLAAAGASSGGRLRAVIAPHAGYVYSGRCAGAAYGLLARGEYKRVILMAPSHYRLIRGAAVPAGDLGSYSTPLGRVPVDREAVDALRGREGFCAEPAGPTREHAVEVHLPFLQVALGDFRLVPILCGEADEAAVFAIAGALVPLLDKDTLLVASSDFTHYGPGFGYVPFEEHVRENLYAWLHEAAGAAAALDLAGFRRHCRTTGDTICGHAPIEILIEALRGLAEPPHGRVLSVYTSGDRTGDFGSSVSYAAVGYFEGPAEARKEAALKEHRSGTWTPGLSPDEQKTLMAIAQDTLAWVVGGGRGKFDLSRYEVTPRLQEDRATFVTLKIRGQLRGCIGSLAPVEALYLSVHHNAVQAAVRDYRFPPVAKGELPMIDVAVSVLSPIRDIGSLDEFVLGQQGIIMEKGMSRAVYLPEVAPEQGWTKEETLSSLSEKAGLGPDDWRRGARFKIFESVVLSRE